METCVGGARSAPLLGGAERPPFAGGVFIVGAWNVDTCFHFATENLADVDMILEKNWGSAPKLIKNFTNYTEFKYLGCV